MMFKVEELTLITGAPIRIPHTPVKIEQPSIKEIALLGEDIFFQSMNVFFISPEPLEEFVNEIDTLTSEEKALFLKDATAYENLKFLIKASFISGMGRDQMGVMRMLNNAFQLMIPAAHVHYNQDEDELFLSIDNNSHLMVLDKELFLIFKDIATQVFLLDTFFQGATQEEEMSEAAKRIADKIAASEKRIQELNGEEEEKSYFSRLISILGVHKDFDYLTSLTIYQLQNQFERFGLYASYNQGVSASLAGATEVEIVDWYKKI